MFLSELDLTTALRPTYLPDEVLLFVQDNVGLYEGKYKLPNHQNGQVYLTSHRICYVDKADPRKNSLSLELREVESFDFYGGFLKSSPKITLYPKPPKRPSFNSRTAAAASSRPGAASPIQRANSPFRPPAPSAPPTSTASWVCSICTFSNPVPRGFDPSTATAHTPLDPCGTCGVKPELKVVLKAAISNATSRQVLPSSIRAPLPFRPAPTPASPPGASLTRLPPAANGNPSDASSTFECARCTFLNHPSLLSCEMCGAPLISQNIPAAISQAPAELRIDSPGPTLSASANGLANGDHPEIIKISFRGGGEKIFYERLKGSMIQRKWILDAAPPVPRENEAAEVRDPDGTVSSNSAAASKHKVGGIAGLEQRVGNAVKKNEMAIGTAFEDLESLMASAKEIIALAETFARQSGNNDSSSALVAESVSQLGLVTTKDIVGGGGSASESLYLSELSRNIAEYLTDDARGVLKKAGDIITLVDLWAMFNRARGGVELVSPNDFEKAARLWEKLRLPVRLRTFRSGVLVVQSKDRTDESTVKAIQAWMRDLHAFPPDRPVAWDWQEFGRGVAAQDVAERFGWSIGVAEEELEMAEEKGVLCREQGIEGVKYWENYIDTGEYRKKRRKMTPEDQIYKALKESGML